MRLVDRHQCQHAGRVEGQLVSSDPGIQVVALSEADQCAVKNTEIGHTESSHTLSLTVMELVVASVRSSATGLAVGIQNKQNHRANSYCLYRLLVSESIHY